MPRAPKASSPQGALAKPESIKESKIRIARELGISDVGTVKELSERIRKYKESKKRRKQSGKDLRRIRGEMTALQAERDEMDDAGESGEEEGTAQDLPASTDQQEDRVESEQIDAIDISTNRLQAFHEELRTTVGRTPAERLDMMAHVVSARERALAPRPADTSYARYWRHYETYWVDVSLARGQSQSGMEIDAEGDAGGEGTGADDNVPEDTHRWPITGPKAFHFVKAQRDDKNWGVSSVKTCISALESKRSRDAHLYRNSTDIDVNTKLRDFAPIKEMEQQATRAERNRQDSNMQLKVEGTTIGIATDEDMKKCSVWLLEQPGNTPHNQARLTRNRAMLMTAAGTGFRGNNLRGLRWCELRTSKVAVMELGITEEGVTKVQAMTLFTNATKTNQTGKPEEYHMFRHRDVIMCPVLAMAVSFFYHFHVRQSTLPDFVPNFDDEEAGKWGVRDWFDLYLFPGKHPDREMVYETHNDWVVEMLRENDIQNAKITHMTRSYMAANAVQNGAGENSVKSQGGWAKDGPFHQIYALRVPTDAIVACAGFSGKEIGSYIVPRTQAVVPAELESQLFPWVEEQEEALRTRIRGHKKFQDGALAAFLETMRWFRTVLLQDAAVLAAIMPNLDLFQRAPFNSALFHTFAATARQHATNFVNHRKDAFDRLPSDLQVGLTDVSASMRAGVGQVHDRVDALVSFLQQGRKEQEQRHEEMMETLKSHMEKEMAAMAGEVVAAVTMQLLSRLPKLLPSMLQVDTVAALGWENENSKGQDPTGLTNVETNPSQVTLFVTQQPPSAALGITSPQSNASAPVDEPSAPIEEPSPSARIVVKLPKERNEWRKELEKRLPKLKNHQWKRNMKTGEWWPTYIHIAADDVYKIWKEWKEGLGNFLPVQTLEYEFKANYRFDNKTLMVERCRRKKIIDIIEAVQKAHPSWHSERCVAWVARGLRSPELKITQIHKYLTGENGKKVAEQIVKDSLK